MRTWCAVIAASVVLLTPIAVADSYSELDIKHYAAEGFVTQSVFANGTVFFLVGGGSAHAVFRRSVTTPAETVTTTVENGTATLKFLPPTEHALGCTCMAGYELSFSTKTCVQSSPGSVCCSCDDIPNNDQSPLDPLMVGPEGKP